MKAKRSSSSNSSCKVQLILTDFNVIICRDKCVKWLTLSHAECGKRGPTASDSIPAPQITFFSFCRSVDRQIYLQITNYKKIDK